MRKPLMTLLLLFGLPMVTVTVAPVPAKAAELNTVAQPKKPIPAADKVKTTARQKKFE
jgi:hypothetical protein